MGMALQGRGDCGVTRPLYVTNFGKIILSLYNFYYFVPFIVLYIEYAASIPILVSPKMSANNMIFLLR